MRECTIWLEKPTYNPNPRGQLDVGLYENFPIGWQVDGERNFELSHRLKKHFIDTPEFYMHLWEEICLDVDGCIAGDFPDVERRWLDWQYSYHYGDGYEEVFWREGTEFCLEVDIHPDKWWKLAMISSDENIAGAKREQEWYWNDMPF